MNYNKILVLFLFNILTLQSCQSQDQAKGFILEGKSALTIINRTSDPIKVHVENGYLLPFKLQEIDTMVLAADSTELQLIIQGNSYYNLNIDNEKFKIFSRPKSIDCITISDDPHEITFSGESKKINEFLVARSHAFHSVEADWLPRVNWTHGNEPFQELINKNDSLTRVHQNHLDSHKNTLPTWFAQFENKRLKYLNAHFKLNSHMYRKKLLDRKDKIPEDFLSATVDALPIQDNRMLGNMHYTVFLSDYFGHRCDPLFEKEKPSSREDWVEYYQQEFDVVQDELADEAKDVYLSFVLGNIIESRKHVFEDKWINLVEDEKLKEYLRQYRKSNQILPKGSKLPYFYLPDTSGVYHQPKQYKDQIVLINFWATWCKPCIKEFPIEDNLVKQFNGKPVAVINICMDSKKEKWKEMIAKNNLKTLNFLATENWNTVLKTKFDVVALPHSVLVDWNGEIFQNKCPRASEGVDQLISKLLYEMQK